MIQINTKPMEVSSDESVFPRLFWFTFIALFIFFRWFFLHYRITAKWIREHCRKHGLYQTPHLNEVLYLQHQGKIKYPETLCETQLENQKYD